MQIGPRACGKHKCGRAHKALAPIAIGQSLDDSSRKFMIQSCETIHVDLMLSGWRGPSLGL